jgi:hypothetical protein
VFLFINEPSTFRRRRMDSDDGKCLPISLGRLKRAKSPVPALHDACGDENDDSDEWDEMEVTGEQTTCLFCPLQFLTIAVALDHCRTEHNFDLLELKNKYNMDCYSYIKMINYIRMQQPDPKILTESSVALWDDDAYLKTGEMESWLMYGTRYFTNHDFWGVQVLFQTLMISGAPRRRPITPSTAKHPSAISISLTCRGKSKN